MSYVQNSLLKTLKSGKKIYSRAFKVEQSAYDSRDMTGLYMIVYDSQGSKTVDIYDSRSK